MPFRLPVKLSVKLPVSRFKSEETTRYLLALSFFFFFFCFDCLIIILFFVFVFVLFFLYLCIVCECRGQSPDFILQKRKRSFRWDDKNLYRIVKKTFNWEDKYLYRIVTLEKTEGFRTNIAVSNDLKSLIRNEWTYIVKELPGLIPPALNREERVLWLIAHFTQKTLNEHSRYKSERLRIGRPPSYPSQRSNSGASTSAAFSDDASENQVHTRLMEDDADSSGHSQGISFTHNATPALAAITNQDLVSSDVDAEDPWCDNGGDNNVKVEESDEKEHLKESPLISSLPCGFSMPVPVITPLVISNLGKGLYIYILN